MKKIRLDDVAVTGGDGVREGLSGEVTFQLRPEHKGRIVTQRSGEGTFQAEGTGCPRQRPRSKSEAG